MEASNLTGLGKVFKFDRCRKYFPRYDKNTFFQQIKYTEEELIQYFPQKFIDEYDQFKNFGNAIKVGFWAVDIAFVSFCHKIKLLSKLLGSHTWRLFIFKIAAIAFPLSFMDRIQEDAKNQYYQGLYQGVNKFYKRYKQSGDILDLNVKTILEEKQSEFQKIYRLNQFNLVHGVGSRLESTIQSGKIV